MEIKANFIDIERYKIYPVKVVIDNQKIMSITKMNEHCSTYSCTGASMPHIHKESSMLPPSRICTSSCTAWYGCHRF